MADPLNGDDQWEEMAATFKGTADVGIPPTKRMLEFMNAEWPFSAAKSIFDTGCGYGTVIQMILNDFGSCIPTSAALLAADSSNAWIKYLQKHREAEISKGSSIWQRVSIKTLDAQDLEGIPDGSVSHATAGMVLFMVPDPRKALRETRRILTEENGGGLLALSSWQSSDWIDMMSLVSEIEPEAPVFKVPVAWKTPNGVKAELEACGYRDVKSVPVETTMSYESHEGFVDYLIEKLPNMRMATKDMSREKVQQLRQRMIDQMKQVSPKAPGVLKGTTIVALGKK